MVVKVSLRLLSKMANILHCKSFKFQLPQKRCDIFLVYEKFYRYRHGSKTEMCRSWTLLFRILKILKRMMSRTFVAFHLFIRPDPFRIWIRSLYSVYEDYLQVTWTHCLIPLRATQSKQNPDTGDTWFSIQAYDKQYLTTECLIIHDYNNILLQSRPAGPSVIVTTFVAAILCNTR